MSLEKDFVRNVVLKFLVEDSVVKNLGREGE